MKRIFVVMMTILLCSSSVSAMDYYYQTVRNGIVGLGQAIERVDGLPIINKLTNILPFAVVATSLKECPMQTVAVLAGVLLYVLSHNEAIRSKLCAYDLMHRMGLKRNQAIQTPVDESLFVFDGEDEEDAEEENDTEDSLLEEEDDDDAIRTTTPARSAVFQRL